MNMLSDNVTPTFVHNKAKQVRAYINKYYGSSFETSVIYVALCKLSAQDVSSWTIAHLADYVCNYLGI